MLASQTLVLVPTFVILANVYSCVVKVPLDKHKRSYWDHEDSKRLTDKSCVCGQFDFKDWTAQWNVYVHVNSPSTNTKKVCIGTIVTSNLVVTSHKCLLLEGRKLRAYDYLRLGRKLGGSPNVATLEELSVTNTKTPQPTTQTFPVLDVFLNPNFAMSSELGVFAENDMALIKVDADFIQSQYKPICVPWVKAKQKIGNVSGFYYSYAEDDPNGVLRINSDIPHRHFGDILEKQVCYRRLFIGNIENEMKQPSFDKTLCFRFQVVEKHTQVPGGPLVYTPNESAKPATAFLMGVSTIISSNEVGSGYEASTGQDYAYFSSVKALVKFIEHFALKSKSVWCSTPQMKLNKKAGLLDQSRGSKWPWDDLPKPISRDESLDCVCGLQNYKTPGTRIAGGTEVPERIYGWMANLIIDHNNDGKLNLCGGSVINDRVILTAAHCVVNDNKIQKGSGRVAVDPKNIQVTLNAHQRRNDPSGKKVAVSAVLFHPDYLIARKSHPMFYDTDIAMLILKQPLQFARNNARGIRPICLRPSGTYVAVLGQDAVAAGWGLTNPDNTASMSNYLQEITVPIINLDECRRVARTRIPNNFLCAGTLNRFRDAARGDSGGPLMMLDSTTDQWWEVGTVSWGEDVHNSVTNKVETAALYADLQKLMPFVDFHSQRIHAKWCKTEP